MVWPGVDLALFLRREAREDKVTTRASPTVAMTPRRAPVSARARSTTSPGTGSSLALILRTAAFSLPGSSQSVSASLPRTGANRGAGEEKLECGHSLSAW